MTLGRRSMIGWVISTYQNATRNNPEREGQHEHAQSKLYVSRRLRERELRRMWTRRMLIDDDVDDRGLLPTRSTSEAHPPTHPLPLTCDMMITMHSMTIIR